MPYRIQHRFWLDIERDDEAQINDQVVFLKQQRSFAATVRDGIRLICDLRAGHIDVLLELFPWIVDKFTAQTGGEGDMQRQLERLEQMFLAQASGLKMGPKPLDVPRIAGPAVNNDDDLLVVTKAKSDGSSARNFLESAFNLIQ